MAKNRNCVHLRARAFVRVCVCDALNSGQEFHNDYRWIIEIKMKMEWWMCPIQTLWKLHWRFVHNLFSFAFFLAPKMITLNAIVRWQSTKILVPLNCRLLCKIFRAVYAFLCLPLLFVLLCLWPVVFLYCLLFNQIVFCVYLVTRSRLTKSNWMNTMQRFFLLLSSTNMCCWCVCFSCSVKTTE